MNKQKGVGTYERARSLLCYYSQCMRDLGKSYYWMWIFSEKDIISVYEADKICSIRKIDTRIFLKLVADQSVLEKTPLHPSALKNDFAFQLYNRGIKTKEQLQMKADTREDTSDYQISSLENFKKTLQLASEKIFQEKGHDWREIFDRKCKIIDIWEENNSIPQPFKILSKTYNMHRSKCIYNKNLSENIKKEFSRIFGEDEIIDSKG